MIKYFSTLRISIVQSDIIWEDVEGNLRHYGELLGRLKGKADLVVLPELFTTGSSMRAKDLAEPNNGRTIAALKRYARECGFAIIGSFMAKGKTKYYNRAFFITPDEQDYFYDKRHLFSIAGEDECFSAGKERIIVDYHAWRICPLICYDLRFPVWSRNVKYVNEYDLLVYVANWPSVRRNAWKTLLQARAIENMSFVCGVNRIGEDANGISYHGGSVIYSPRGKRIVGARENEDVVITSFLKHDDVRRLRSKFPLLRDADPFKIKDGKFEGFIHLEEEIRRR